jgi:uroporphyrinogen-III synthase
LASHPWSGETVWVARGEGGREWLIERWKAAGADVRTVVTYRRGPPQPTEQEHRILQAALAQPAGHVWLLSSSEALDHLMPLVQTSLAEPSGLALRFPFASSTQWAAQAHVLATHPRILEQARSHGLHQVRACRADLSSVVAAYNQFHREP